MSKLVMKKKILSNELNESQNLNNIPNGSNGFKNIFEYYTNQKKIQNQMLSNDLSKNKFNKITKNSNNNLTKSNNNNGFLLGLRNENKNTLPINTKIQNGNAFISPAKSNTIYILKPSETNNSKEKLKELSKFNSNNVTITNNNLRSLKSITNNINTNLYSTTISKNTLSHIKIDEKNKLRTIYNKKNHSQNSEKLLNNKNPIRNNHIRNSINCININHNNNWMNSLNYFPSSTNNNANINSYNLLCNVDYLNNQKSKNISYSLTHNLANRSSEVKVIDSALSKLISGIENNQNNKEKDTRKYFLQKFTAYSTSFEDYIKIVETKGLPDDLSLLKNIKNGYEKLIDSILLMNYQLVEKNKKLTQINSVVSNNYKTEFDFKKINNSNMSTIKSLDMKYNKLNNSNNSINNDNNNNINNNINSNNNNIVINQILLTKPEEDHVIKNKNICKISNEIIINENDDSNDKSNSLDYICFNDKIHMKELKRVNSVHSIPKLDIKGTLKKRRRAKKEELKKNLLKESDDFPEQMLNKMGEKVHHNRHNSLENV